MAMLAIKGHATRGKEVIETLEMLGGKNKIFSDGLKWFNGTNVDSYYTIEEDNYIHIRLNSRKGDYIKFTLEEFLEKFPYKVGDKVNAPCKGCIKTITSMEWDTYLNTVTYKLDNRIYTNIDQLKVVNDLQPYKEETIKESIDETNKVIFDTQAQSCDIMNDIIKENREQIKIDIPEGYEFFGIDDNDKVVFTKIQPKYPKTYIECAKSLESSSTTYVDGYKSELLEKLQELLICRDAYWKIAGDWKPDWENGLSKFCIAICENRIIKSDFASTNFTLAFPTAEMRDVFYENFKDLIEQCKELL